MKKMKKTKKTKRTLIILLIALLVVVLPTAYLSADKPVPCENEGGSGSVALKGSHVGQSWEFFDHENCNIEPGQYLWHLVLSPVDKSATATINGVAGTNHGASIHWTFVNSSSTTPNWVAEVSAGLKYKQDCKLKSELRVSHTCFDGNGDDEDEEEEEEQEEQEEQDEKDEEEDQEEKITDLIKELPFTK